MGSEERLNFLWNPNLNEWEKAPAAVLTERMVAVGQVGAAGAHKLYWIDCNPSAGNSVWELTDDTDGSTAIVLDEFHTARESHVSNFSPPIPFDNGIYLKTFTLMTSITFGYI